MSATTGGVALGSVGGATMAGVSLVVNTDTDVESPTTPTWNTTTADWVVVVPLAEELEPLALFAALIAELSVPVRTLAGTVGPRLAFSSAATRETMRLPI